MSHSTTARNVRSPGEIPIPAESLREILHGPKIEIATGPPKKLPKAKRVSTKPHRKPRASKPREVSPRFFSGFGKGGAPTGTYAMRGGQLVLISREFDGAGPSSKLRGDTSTTMFTDLPRKMHPARKTWRKWARIGKTYFARCDNDADRRDYQTACRDAGYHREWTK